MNKQKKIQILKLPLIVCIIIIKCIFYKISIICLLNILNILKNDFYYNVQSIT